VLEVRQLLSTITVTSLADNTTTDGLVTLREALTAANSNKSVDGSTAGQAGVQDVIVFQSGLTGTVHLALGQLPITDSVRIVGLGAGSTDIDAGGLSRVFAATSTAGNVEFDNLTISGGKTTANFDSGAGIQFKSTGTLTLLNSVVSNNATTGIRSYGGGIFTGSGAVTMTNSVLAGNSTTGGYACGGGVFTGKGAITVQNSTVTGNSTAGLYAHGGGMYSQVGNITVTNSTFFGNSTAGVHSYGGGFIAWSGNIVVTNSTITQNVANGGDRSEGGGFVDSKGSITLINSIVSGNTCSSGFGPDVKFNNFANTATAQAFHSLIGVNTNTPRFAYPFQPAPLGHPDANGNLIGTAASPINAMLSAAANNGGPTVTIAPLAGSPVIDAGSNALAVDPVTQTALQYDQRGAGFNRIAGAAVDMGAFETQVANSNQIVVTSLGDSLAQNGQTTLRQALAIANAAPAGVEDEIVFQAGLSGTIHLALGQLVISHTVHITGLGATNTVIDAGGLSRVFSVTSSAGDVEFENLTVSGGKTTANFASGGGILYLGVGKLTLLNSVMSGNETTGVHSYGGGIFSKTGAVTLTGSSVIGNSTAGQYSTGGGISTASGAVTIMASTISGNSTTGNYAAGGGLYTTTGAILVTNSTVVGNSTAGASSRGGGIATVSGPVKLTNTTVAGNSVTSATSAGGGISADKASLTVANSIVAGNSSTSGNGPDIKFSNFSGAATLTSKYSLIGINSGTPLAPAPVGAADANGNLIGTSANPINPNLGPLANNGGPTKTMALLVGSPALNSGSSTLAVDPSTNSALTYDQRGAGFNRINGGHVDMGAIES
jgi:hypothetical protein